jgi:hypothetical protein
MTSQIRPAYFRVYWIGGWDEFDGDANGGVWLVEYDTYAEAWDSYVSISGSLSARMQLRLHHGEGHLAIINHLGSVLKSEIDQPAAAVAANVAEQVAA